MKYKYYLIGLIALFLVLPLLNADITIPTTPLEDKAGAMWDNIYSFDERISLGKAEIKSSLLWIIPLDPIEDIELKSNTYTCVGSESEPCEARTNITTYKDTKLIDSVTFDGQIRDYQVYLLSKSTPKQVEDWNTSCIFKGFYENGTVNEVCTSKLLGKHTEYDEKWIPYNYEVLPAGTYTIKLVGHKKASKSVEWYITSQGKKITEWATWGSSVSDVDGAIRAYYKLDENTGRAIKDYTGRYNASLKGTPTWQTGKLNSGLNNTAINQGFIINSTNLPALHVNFSISYWVKRTNSGDNSFLLYTDDSIYIGIGIDHKPFMTVTVDPQLTATTPVPVEAWSFVAITVDGGHHRIYINGTVYADQNGSNDGAITPRNITIGSNSANSQGTIGDYDEIGFFNRSLSQAEILEIYNSGVGKQPPFTTSGSSVTLNSPIDSFVTNNQTINFNCSVSLIGSTNVNISSLTNETGTLKINQTKSLTGTINSTTFTNTFADGTYLWTCKACDADGDCGQASSNRTLTVDSTAPVVSILYPTGTINGLTNGQSLGLNYSITGSPQACGREYNGINTTIANCAANTTFTYVSGVNSIIVWANDSAGNYNSNSKSWAVDFVVNNQSYNATTYETSSEEFMLNTSINSSVSTNTYLVYDGLTYLATRQDLDGSAIFTKTIDIPTLTTETNKSFYWLINTTSAYTTAITNQTVKPFNFSYCYNNLPRTLNFTIKDEQLNIPVKASFSAFFNLWIGNGATKKNYSYADTSVTNSTFAFCTNINNTIKADASIAYSNPEYLARTHYLNALPINNATQVIPLYLLNASVGLKFYFTVVQGAGTRVTNADVSIDRWLTSNRTYTFNSARQTDNIGQFIEYLIQDGKYKFTVTKNGVLVGVVEQSATCTASPCEITLSLNTISPDTVFDDYYATYSNNTRSTLTFNPTNKMVNYTFLDVLGTAHYFKLVVDKSVNNLSQQNICNVISYTTSGVLFCNVTNYDGDFIARGYISRSPDRPDITLSFFINALNTLQNSPYVLLFFLGWIITITMAALAVSRGNPSTTMAGFMIAWTSAKLMAINPFGWVIVVLVDLLAFWIMNEVGS